jgi:ABC-2 type transport system ATP-binding protein
MPGVLFGAASTGTGIEVRGLSKRFGSTLAVDRLSFDVCPGMVTGFLGPNGAGKTTTIRIILGSTPPGRGGRQPGCPTCV